MSMDLDPDKKLQQDETGLLLDPHELRCIAHMLAIAVLEMPFPVGPMEHGMLQAAALAVHNAVCEDMRVEDDLPVTETDHPPTPQSEEMDPWQLFSEN